MSQGMFPSFYNFIPQDIKPATSDFAEFDLEKELSRVIGLESVKQYIPGQIMSGGGVRFPFYFYS